MTLSSFVEGLAQGQQKADRPNILWLDAEDLSPDLGCYGRSLVHTPNLDRLARQGVRYERAFVPCPVCSPSRSAFATGMYPTSIGAHHHRSNRDTPLSELTKKPVRVITQYLQEAGYFTVNGAALSGGRKGKLDYNFDVNFDEAFDGTQWSEREPGQPFFAELHFHETHRGFKADGKRPIDPESIELPPYHPDRPLTRADWALYLETVQHLDRRVGRVLQKLEDAGIADNTAVFFTGDHGRPMVWGKQWLKDSGIQIPLIVRWPGRLDGGEVIEGMVSTLDLAPTWLDIAGAQKPDHLQGRSLLDEDYDGREYIFASRDRCDATYDRIRCVRTRRYKYIRNFYPWRPYAQFNEYKMRTDPLITLLPHLHEKGELEPAEAQFMQPNRPPEELYDLSEDPHEVRNLADSPDHEGVLKKLRQELNDWMCRTGDRGRVPEDPDGDEYTRASNRDERQWSNFVDELGFDPREDRERYLDYWRDRYSRMKDYPKLKS
ncbi:MAG: sulfatase [Planctomycetota bacterium]